MKLNLKLSIYLILTLNIVDSSVLFAQEAKCSSSPLCAISPDGWCCSPKGDPCAFHANRKSCMSDSNCEGMKYRGESAVACEWDERGFAANCPTVGCISICEKLAKEDCLNANGRCAFEASGCVKFREDSK